MSARSRWSARVGSWSGRWNGARNTPKRRGHSVVTLTPCLRGGSAPTPHPVRLAGARAPGGARWRSLLEQVRLQGGDPVVQRLERQPSSEVAADEGGGGGGRLLVDEPRRAGGGGQQLGLARPLHGDEPPD